MSKIYISKHAKYRVGIRGERPIPVVDGQGRTVMMDSQRAFTAEFEIQPMPFRVRQEAEQRFRKIPYAFGSEPERGDGICTSPDPLTNGLSFEGEPAELRLSMFDTSTIPDAALRAEVEEKLDSHVEHGWAFIRIDELRTGVPFARYDEITGAGADKKLGRILRDTGGDVDVWMAYERENQNRESVLAEYQRVADERESAKREHEALSGTI